MSQTTVGVALSSGMCESTYVDWNLNNAHHFDARSTRTCKSGTSISHSWTETVQLANYISGIHRDSVCYSLKDQRNAGTGSDCAKNPLAGVDTLDGMNVIFNTANCSNAWWYISSTGITMHNAGNNDTTDAQTASC